MHLVSWYSQSGKSFDWLIPFMDLWSMHHLVRWYTVGIFDVVNFLCYVWSFLSKLSLTLTDQDFVVRNYCCVEDMAVSLLWLFWTTHAKLHWQGVDSLGVCQIILPILTIEVFCRCYFGKRTSKRWWKWAVPSDSKCLWGDPQLQ
jgi:hypothetical protein